MMYIDRCTPVMYRSYVHAGSILHRLFHMLRILLLERSDLLLSYPKASLDRTQDRPESQGSHEERCREFVYQDQDDVSATAFSLRRSCALTQQAHHRRQQRPRCGSV